ncbi:MAG: DPP IV N-terminal domain-containing protein [Pirellulales bacterium]|nr:DPP IV N-terminal domain-containing protein [Pirellulales bacterium]
MKHRIDCIALHVLFAALFTGLSDLSAQETAGSASETPRTVAEQSDFQATATYADVMAFCRELDERSPVVALGALGTSYEGRSLPLLILANPSIDSPEAARKSGKLVVFAMGNIHAGEVCGKEALLMLARDIGLAEKHELLNDLVIVLAPIMNADGNERFSTDHRPHQAGPSGGVGQRANAQGLDINRDLVKLETPEARGLARFLNAWDPAVVVDCHTTNGSYHRYALTYDSPRHPATHADLIRFARDEFLPEVSRRLEQETGYRTFFYGNFNRRHKRWNSYPAQPRYATQYIGLRNRIGILSEAYAYTPYRDRVLVTRDFVRHCFQLAAEQKKAIAELLEKTDRETGKADSTTPSKRDSEPPESDSEKSKDDGKSSLVGTEQTRNVAIRFEPAPLPEKVVVLGYVEEEKDGRQVATDKARDYRVRFYGETRATLQVARPHAYLIPPEYQAVIENLQYHGATVHVFREDIELDVETYTITNVKKAKDAYQGHHPVEADAKLHSQSRRFPAGTCLVPTDNRLGSLLVNLLEPQSSDGLVTWNFFDDALHEGQEFPIARLPKSTPILTAPLPARFGKRPDRKPITFETLYGQRPPQLGGHPAGGFRWLDDGQHFEQTKEGRVWKVHAETGRCEEVSLNVDAIAQAIGKLPGIESKEAKRLAQGIRHQRLNKDRTAALFTQHSDLYLATLDGKTAVRLTDATGTEELATFSPDGRYVAFVRDYDLYVVDTTTQKERRLTHGGTTTIRNGKADWVYFEEIYLRRWDAFWWSPDSSRIAFQQFDDSGVDSFVVPDNLNPEQRLETDRYPLAGRPNPRVRLGIVHAAGGDIQWADLDGYSPDATLITHFAWMPDSKSAFVYVQDRAQRWLDVVRLDTDTGKMTPLLRDTTEAWVDNPGDPQVLKDGSFLLPSERDGWKHLYHFDKNGQLIRQVTQGAWEVRQVEAVREEEGWIYFSGTCDSPIAENFYRVQIDGSQFTRLTHQPGNHRGTLSPKGELFVDTWSDHKTPTQVQLRRFDGQTVRVLDTNPIPALDEYCFGHFELVRIKNRDGFILEGSLIKPPDFDSARKYPVWLLTYGGPHAPTLVDSWQGGRTYEQMLANMGILVFRVDPGPASGKGAKSNWKAYRQLGVQELRDLEDALDWLAEKPFVDTERIGMSGHSYGGFLTAFALTHSDRFAAGIAGAPVTDWRNYDTIYTERYMDTPQNNPEGYKNTSVVSAAKDLHGRLLLIHGGIDDNVHLANTTQLARTLQQADKRFEMMVYPANRHGISGKHYQRLMVDFIRRTILE